MLIGFETNSLKNTLFEGIVIWFEVALVHILYTVEFININRRIELAFKQVAYEISYSFMVEKWEGLMVIIISSVI